MKTKPIVLMTMMVMSSNVFALKLRNQKHPLISKTETKIEQDNFKKQKAAEKKRERLARREWKKTF